MGPESVLVGAVDSVLDFDLVLQGVGYASVDGTKAFPLCRFCCASKVWMVIARGACVRGTGHVMQAYATAV